MFRFLHKGKACVKYSFSCFQGLGFSKLRLGTGELARWLRTLIALLCSYTHTHTHTILKTFLKNSSKLNFLNILSVLPKCLILYFHRQPQTKGVNFTTSWSDSDWLAKSHSLCKNQQTCFPPTSPFSSQQLTQVSSPLSWGFATLAFFPLTAPSSDSPSIAQLG